MVWDKKKIFGKANREIFMVIIYWNLGTFLMKIKASESFCGSLIAVLSVYQSIQKLYP